MSTIYVTAGGAEYVGGTITETGGLDIRTDSLYISLGTAKAPGTWETPVVDEAPTISSRTAKKLIDSQIAPGTYFVWLRLGDTSEAPVRRVDGQITVV